MNSPKLAQYQALMNENLLSAQLGNTGEYLLSLFENKTDIECSDEEAQLRLDIYRNNVIYSLKSALGELYPVVKRLIGNDCFDGAAVEFIRQHLPKQAALLHYGREFCQFIVAFGPCSHLLFLHDVAQLEFDYNQAYHSAQGDDFDPQMLSKVAADKLGEITFECHPSLQLLTSQWPIDDIWQQNQQASPEMIDVDNCKGVHLVVYRPELTVQMINLDPNCFVLLHQLFNGKSINDAWSRVINQAEKYERAIEDSELGSMLGYLFSLKVFTSFTLSD